MWCRNFVTYLPTYRHATDEKVSGTIQGHGSHSATLDLTALMYVLQRLKASSLSFLSILKYI